MASACEFPEELVTKPSGYVALIGLDTQFNAIHHSIWDTFTMNRKQERPLNIKILPGDSEFPRKKPKQRTSYEFYIPKGIFKTNWMKKHLYGLPALVVVFYDLDWSDPQWKEKQTECASRVAVIRSSLYGRNTKIAVVLIQKNMPLPPGEDVQAVQRAESICQACELTSKSLFVLPFSDHLQGYVTRLQDAFYNIAQSYYFVEAKYVKQHKELLNKSQHQLLFVRHQFKIAFYNEMRQDAAAALKHYKMSYQFLLEHRLTDINNLEVKVCAGFLNYKICKISFQLTAPLDAISQFQKHIDYFKSKYGPSELLFEHSAWMAKQFSLFSELFNETIKNGLQAIQTQHPGFYYQQAANQTVARREHCKRICQFSEPVSSDPLSGFLEYYGQRPWRPGCQANEAPDPELEQAGILCLQSQELKVEHFWIIIPLLSSAVSQFRDYKSGRMKLYLMMQMGEEYFKAKDFTKSLTLLNRVLPFYRAERWFKLLSSILVTGLRCAYLTASVQDYITFALESIGKHSCISNDEKTRVQMNLMRLAKSSVPEPEPGCNEESINQAKSLWQDLMTKEDKQTYVIEMGTLASFVECRASFDVDSFHVDQKASVKAYLRSVGMYPIQFSELGIKFSNPVYNEKCIKKENETSELYLEPLKVKSEEFSFALSSIDISTKLEIKQVYLNLGENVVLTWAGAGLDANISPSFDSSNYGGERLPIKISSDGNIIWESINISPFTDVLSREALISLEVEHHPPSLVDEFYPFTVKIVNKEKAKISKINLKITETIEAQKVTPVLYQDVDMVDGKTNRGTNNLEFDVEEMNADAELIKTVFIMASEMGKRTIEFELIKTVFIMASEMGKRTIEFEVSYYMSVEVDQEMVECICTKNETVTVDVQIPFSISVKIASTKFQQMDRVHVGETFTTITYIKSTSPWPIDIISSKMLLNPGFKCISQDMSKQIAGLELKKNDVASECQCLVAPINEMKSLLGSDVKTFQIGQYLLEWKRKSWDCVVTTKVNLPNINVECIPFFIETELPPFGCVQECMLARYTLHNRMNTVLEVEVVVKASGAFMLAGNSEIQFKVLPHGKHTLSYNMYPLVCGEVLLPKIHVNLPQYFDMDSDAVAQRMLPTHVFVKPRGERNNGKQQDIKVM